MEVYAGENALEVYGPGAWFPEETQHALQKFVVSIKGPLATPIGGGIRSLNVAMRQNLDLYACVRPIRYFPGVTTPMADSSYVDMIIFRENTEDIYAGIEYAGGLAGSAEADPLPAARARGDAASVSRRAPASASSRCRRKARSG